MVPKLKVVKPTTIENKTENTKQNNNNGLEFIILKVLIMPHFINV